MLDLETKSPLGLLTLLSMRGVGPVTAERVARKCEHLEDALDAFGIKLADGSSVRDVITDAYDRAWRIWEKAQELSVRLVSAYDPAYPETLKKITDRPPVLFVRGSLPEDGRMAACIGTREPSEFGTEVTRRIVDFLVEKGWATVSGLALGIDTEAHEATVRRGGRTIAVMAGGLDSVYPKANAALAEEILDQGGALVSEQPFGAPPTPRNLVQRDRLQSGLSIGTFVMQTGIVGGSMHTVRFTLQQGRLLFAPVPFGRHAEEPKCQGILALAKLTGAELADAIKAKDDYRKFLLTNFRNRPVARGISHRDEYDEVLELLEQARAKYATTEGTASPQQRPLL